MSTSLPSLHTKEYYKIAQKPSWVKDIGPILPIDEDIKGQEAIEHLLVEDQVSIKSNLIEHFVKTVRHIANESALERASHLKLDFNRLMNRSFSMSFQLLGTKTLLTYWQKLISASLMMNMSFIEIY